MNLLNKQCAMQAGAVLAAAILLIGAASPASAATGGSGFTLTLEDQCRE